MTWAARRDELLLAAALPWMLAVPASAQQGAPSLQSETLFLEVTLNQTRKPGLYRFQRDGQRLSATALTLQQLGLRLPDHGQQDLIALDALSGLHFAYDAALQRIGIDVPVALLDAAVTRLAPQADLLQAGATSSPGVLLDYDLYASHQQAASNLSGAGELRAFGMGNGLFRQSAIAGISRTAGQAWHGQAVRLDTQWQWNFPERMVTVTVGDTLSSSLSWSRTLRLGGLRIGRDFGLQPARSISPLPEFLGEASVPSSVDLYINGIRQYGAQVPAGPFQLGGIPGVDGAGNAQLVITDAFGRTRTIDFPFYASQDLLDGGLSDCSFAVGHVRRGYGLDSFDYDRRLAASASWRRGLSDRLTAEAHAEASGAVANAGAGAIWLIERAGVFSASLAGSQADGRSGQQYALAWRWNTGRYNLALDTQRTRGDYRDVASLHGAAPPQVSERALAGVNVGGLGNFSLSYVRAQYAGLDRARYASLFWSRSLFDTSAVNFSLNQNLEDRRDRSLYLGWTIALGTQHQAGASWQRANGRDVLAADVSRATPTDGGRGWRVQARAGAGNAGGLAESRWRLQHGNYAAGIASLGGDTYGYAEASGGLVGMGGRWFASRELDQAFALVETGVAGVPVRLQNRTIGVTDREGRLLITPLNPWQRNEVSIDPMDLPLELRPERVQQVVVPRGGTGTRVQFPIRRVHAALIVLHDAQGQPLPVGSQVAVEGGGGTSVVGYDGETYLEFLGDGSTLLQVELPQGRCQARFDYPKASGLPRIGPLRCEATP